MTEIHRGGEVARLNQILTGAGPGLTVLSVSGTGGVGKSYLVQHVLAQLRAQGERMVVLSVDGSERERRADFAALIDQLAPRRLPPPADPKKDYFPHVRDVLAIHHDVLGAAVVEMKQSGQPEELREAVTALLRLGRSLNRTVPLTREYLDVGFLGVESGPLHDGLDGVWELARSLDAVRDSTWVPGVVRDLLGVSLKNRVRRELFAVTAEMFVADLHALAVGYRWQDVWKGTQRKVEGIERAVLWIDDYEALSPALGPFLVGHLAPQLAASELPVVLLIGGRDDVRETDPSWAQHLHRSLAEPIRLAPFTESQAREYLAAAGIEEERATQIWQRTQGFPFLLSLLAEEADDDGGVLFLQRFYERTTRWMSETERGWFDKVCYLESVNEDTLQAFFSPEQAEVVQAWFQREASIRDPRGASWSVRPIIRDKVLRTLEARSPSKHRSALSKANDPLLSASAEPLKGPYA